MQQNRTDATAVKYATGIIVKKIQTFNIRVNDLYTLLFYKSVIESKSFNIDRYLKLTATILQCHPCYVTAHSGSHFVTSSFVRRLQCFFSVLIFFTIRSFCNP